MDLTRINADRLYLLQGRENSGRGISCVRQLVSELRSGRMIGAEAIANNEWDEISRYPAVAKMIKDLGLVGSEAYIIRR